MPAEVKEEQSSEGPPPLTLPQEAKEPTLDTPSANDELDTPTSIASVMTSTNESSTETDTPQQTDTEESKAVEQEGEQALSETPESSETQLENFPTPDTPDLTSTPVAQDNTPAEQTIPEANTEPSECLTPATPTSSTTTAPPQPHVVLQPGELQPVNPDSQSRVYTLPDSYRTIGGDLCTGYGSLSRATLHSYWPAKNFQPGAHYTLPFLRDSYAPAGLSSQTEDDGLSERGENPLDMKTDHPTASYPTLGGIHQFRPITTMELLREPSRTRGGYDDAFMAQLEGNLNPFFQAMCRAQTLQFPHKRSSMVSLDSIRRDPRWRDPNLHEVISMLSHPMDPVKSNAAAYLQHLCYENDRIKQEVRQLNGVPILVELLDHPKAEVHRKACGALRNISFGKDHNNKMAIKSCDGIQALVRLLRKSSSMEVKELVTGTLWNLSSHEPLKMMVINHGLQTLTDEIIIPHSGWRRDSADPSKMQSADWTTVFKNTSGCLRNVSSDGAEARQRLRECQGLVDALLHALQSAVLNKDTDNKSVENCVCILRNLSYHVHKEIPGAERFQEPHANHLMRSVGHQKKKNEPDCFGGKRPKEEWFNQGWKNGFMDRKYGLELLYQPEVVRLYLSLLTCSHNHNTLEAAAGALQNLAAGHWAWSSYIRATVRKEKGLPILVELLRSDVDKVVRAVAIALRNLAMDRRNKDLIGSYALRDLVGNLPCGQQHPAKNLEGDTVVSILNTIHEIITDSPENARALIQGHAVQKLVAINKSSQSARETKAASHVLQTIWAYKDLRNNLIKAGWNKGHFKPTTTGVTKKSKSGKQGSDDITLPLMDKNQDVYSSLEPNDRVGDGKGPVVERDALQAISERKHFIRAGRPAVGLMDNKPPPLDSWV
ncbi:armadillo repeat protein deleted in velo-cardio-facial syndrome homolog isoform X2 [Seriola lalandi dorsalis]|uniref:armadillo repeat protein deleted in velo-cardio-facial syndrome homolog isoform X2 n=1 Tax=Seriola lalandi dorsalis TaxID=1841481 RepID=UPI000C6F9F0F|nr:armadillo repeat protein deleted in velo-cardio-facial syndrome homolog isoform X2 [Seriola lalandi dorsalis]XP_056258724.1 splicing regulator ARVCF isoform X2 [Seriola aureovittata]